MRMEIEMTRKILIALVLSLVAMLSLFGGGLAQEATPPAVESITDDQVNAIAAQLYCPVCENIPLDVCPTQACAEWRELIRLRLAQGRTEQEIKDEFAKQYGDRVLASPPAKGLHVAVYIIPPIAILAGAFILFQALRSMRRGSSGHVTETVPASPVEQNSASTAQTEDYIRRVEEELRKR